MSISPRTMESYRAWVMEKTGAANLAELVRWAMQLERVERDQNADNSPNCNIDVFFAVTRFESEPTWCLRLRTPRRRFLET